MKILKRCLGEGQIFDTDNIDSVTPSNLKLSHEKWLCNTHHMSDYQYLLRYFPPEHHIFERFGESYYYQIDDVPCLEALNVNLP